MSLSSRCFMCKENPSASYKFKKEMEHNSTRNVINIIENSSIYCHRMCPECLIRYIFIKYITLFQKPSKNYTFTCPCKNGKLNLSYEQLIDVFQNKTFDNLQKKKEKLCITHNKKYSHFCKNCNVDICPECISESYEDHFNHRIEDKKTLLKRLKNFFDNLNLRYSKFKDFNDNFDKICKKFKEILEKNYNETLISIDKIINDLIDFRAKYSSHYKEKVISTVQTLKILKLFYCNYYYDIKKAERTNDFKIYKYLNQINFELDDVTFMDNKEALDKLEKIKNCSEYLNNNINKILDINYSFKKITNGYRKCKFIKVSDKEIIKSILKINEYKIIAVEDNAMNYLEENNGEFSIKSKIETNTITSILLLKNGNILTSFGKKKDCHIQEWIQNNICSNSKIYNDDLKYNKMNINIPDIIPDASNNLRISTVEEPYRGRQNSVQINFNNNFNYQLYEKEQSFLSTHKDGINIMIEMDDSMFASGGNDKCIIIWKKDEETQKYKIFQKISKETKNLKGGIKHMIFLYDKRLVSSDSYSIYVWIVEKNKISNPNNFYSLQQKLNIINGNITALYQIREGSIISGSNNSYFEVWNEIDGKYKSVQNENLKINSITCIRQLRDDRIIVGSNQGIIKILDFEINKYKSNENITTLQGMPIQCIECFEDGSFVVGRNIFLHFWKNNESI